MTPLTQAAADPAITETGSLGVYHMKRFWSRTMRNRQARIESDGAEWNRDLVLMFGMGVGLQETLRYMYLTGPSFEEFERWVLERNEGGIEPERIARINAAVTGQPVEPDREVEQYPPVLTGDDMAFWNEHGYVIVHDSIPAESRVAAEKAIWEVVRADPQNPATWYGGPQGPSIWVPLLHHWALRANRKSLRLRKAFAQIWGRTDLWVTIDSGGFNPPETPRWRFPGPFLHWDTEVVSPIPFGVQGLVYLTDTAANQGAFQLVPGFHHKIDAWLAQLPGGANPQEENLAALGAIPIAGKAGDLIIWRQDLPHGSSPNHATLPRIVQYISASPML